MDTIHAQIVKNLNLKIGDIVKVTHRVPSGNLGWKADWIGEMNDFIGKEFRVKDISENCGIGLGYYFPAQCIRFISAKPTTKTIKLNSEYKAIVNKNGEVQVGCQTINIEMVEEVLAAYKELNAE